MYNARSLSSDDPMIELEEEISRIKWNIVGLSEVRTKGQGSTGIQYTIQDYTNRDIWFASW